jgi:16S rRNA (uracil1498-N3)-methyltransferase
VEPGTHVPPRLFVDRPLQAGSSAFALPPGAARHVQVLRLQPGDVLTLFDGRGGEWSARIEAMDRRDVLAQLLSHSARECESPVAVTLAMAMPANDRMDALVEKATELGVAAIQPLLAERSVLRLSGERARKRQAHWQAIAAAACEQCGRNHVPVIHAVQGLSGWLAALAPATARQTRLLLGWREATSWARAMTELGASLTMLSGPEGGFTEGEEDVARLRGFVAVTLGPRVLRADTAPLAALAAISLRSA